MQHQSNGEVSIVISFTAAVKQTRKHVPKKIWKKTYKKWVGNVWQSRQEKSTDFIPLQKSCASCWEYVAVQSDQGSFVWAPPSWSLYPSSPSPAARRSPMSSNEDVDSTTQTQLRQFVNSERQLHSDTCESSHWRHFTIISATVTSLIQKQNTGVDTAFSNAALCVYNRSRVDVEITHSTTDNMQSAVPSTSMNTSSGWKTKNHFGFGFLQIEPSIRSDSFLTQTACSPQFKLKVTKNNFTCIQCAAKEHCKTRPKHSLA